MSVSGEVFAWALIISSPFLMPGVCWFVWHRKGAPRKGLFVAAVIMLLMYGICIVWPYYNHYARITELHQGQGFGITALPIVETFAYVYTSRPFGDFWLLMGLLCAATGQVGGCRWLGVLTRATLAGAFLFFLSQLPKFESTINYVLE